MNRQELIRAASGAFRSRFQHAATHVGFAPGRVELLGNHTDYNGGLVLAAAIDRFTVVAGRRVAAREARIHSIGFDQSDSFAIDAIKPSEPGSWSRYPRGVCWALARRFGALESGFEAVIASDVPLGAGLSSSASLQASFAMFLTAAGVVRDLARMDLAKTLRQSENEFVGVASGVLDQFSVLLAKRGCALWLDCATEEHEVLPLGPAPPAIVICDSKTSRQLSDGMYNIRKEECERVSEYFESRIEHAGAFYLSLVSPRELVRDWDRLDAVGRRRARHVLGENVRVRDGANALRSGDVAELGRLMRQSHRSSRDDFENSSPALDALFEAAAAAPGFLGGKLSGAGWAGCTVNLVQADKTQEFAAAVRASYRERLGLEADVYVCEAADGAGFQALDEA